MSGHSSLVTKKMATGSFQLLSFHTMLDAIRFLLVAFAGLILRLRYRVEVRGLDKVRGLHGALVLPNHPGYMDPPLVMSMIWPALRPRPMLLTSIFHNPLIFWLPRLLDAVEIPDLEAASADARQHAQASIHTVIEGLKQGKNHILWPAGRVYRSTGKESLGAARSLSEILQAVPDANIVLVRTHGLWGSMFTYARTGQQPRIALRLLQGAGILLSNLLLFTPRRPIRISVELLNRSTIPGTRREQVNPFFEKWYNLEGEELPHHVPYHFLFGPRSYEFPPLRSEIRVDLSSVRPQTRDTIAQMIAEKLRQEPGEAERNPDTRLEELGLDSLERMELSLEVERRFGGSSEEVPLTVGGLWVVAENLIERKEVSPAPPQWFKPRRHDHLGMLEPTMGRAFVRRCIESGDDVAVADDLGGLVTFQRLLVGAILLSRRFSAVQARHVGVLLPASVAADMVFFALHLAGKLPVIMNWTTGPANLAHAARVMQLSHVITSRRFVDRTGITIEGTDYLFLEDIRADMGTWEKLLTLLKVKLMPGELLKQLPPQRPDEPAVVLFTSGSEKAPKAVPLTHANILSNLSAALGEFHLTGEDALVGFLPAFHSFGLSVTCVLPILAGARVVHHPDPTDAGAIARKAASYKATLLCGTPTFMAAIIDRARPGELDSIRMAVVGAEKCPESLYDTVAQRIPHGTLIEGYGITECAPIVAVNRQEKIKRGSVGPPLPNVQVKVVDVETHAELPRGQTGMLLVHGPNVFPGYIGEESNPFVQHDGTRWYVTGDLAREDEENYIFLAGRLKRFLKAGGEMISLPAIEEPLARAYPPGEHGPRIAVEGIETHGGRRIVLFTTEPISLREANNLLQDNGLRGIMRLDEVRQLEMLPVLGTGKTDYKVLRAMIES